jgi:hypothetical protein
MENIVENNNLLSWDGWDVVQLIPNPTGWSKPDGAYVNNRWYIQKKFALSTNGWEIPSKLVR